MIKLIETIITGDTRQINAVASKKFNTPVNVLKFLNDSMLEEIGTPSIERHIETTQQLIKKSVTPDNAAALAEDLKIIYGGNEHV